MGLAGVSPHMWPVKEEWWYLKESCVIVTWKDLRSIGLRQTQMNVHTHMVTGGGGIVRGHLDNMVMAFACPSSMAVLTMLKLMSFIGIEVVQGEWIWSGYSGMWFVDDHWNAERQLKFTMALTADNWGGMIDNKPAHNIDSALFQRRHGSFS